MKITVANRLSAILFCLLTPGCLIIQTGVTNPIPGLSTVAVVPFFNLSDQPDRVVDGRQFALAYFSELQKVPGFEVVPVGVTEIAMTENGLDLLNNRDHALELARILKVDVVVVGAVTDYEPYYPPRIGLQVEWLSPQGWSFDPGVQTDSGGRQQLLDRLRKRVKHSGKRRPRHRKRSLKVRAQSVDVPRVRANSQADLQWPRWSTGDGPLATVSEPTTQSSRAEERVELLAPPPRPFGSQLVVEQLSAPPTPLPVKSAQTASVSPDATLKTLKSVRRRGLIELPLSTETAQQTHQQPLMKETPPLPTGTMQKKPYRMPKSRDEEMFRTRPKARLVDPLWIPQLQTDPGSPLMSYSRIFDATDADLMATLRDYVELSGDLRGGGWEAYLQRSDDFIRFAAHQMIVEMLTLHGGEGKRRIVVKWRKYK